MTNRIPGLVAVTLLLPFFMQPAIADSPRPNILIAISDDHSWVHTSIQGSAFVKTPALDSVASSGFLFANAYAGSPGCSPSRAALLTGQHHWMIGPAGTHGSSFPVHYTTFVDLLEEAGYKVGFTGKGWGPGDWLAGGRKKNPAGVEYNDVKLEETPPKGISDTDYAANFQRFLDERREGEPFYFWYGAHEPHLRYAEEGHSEEEMATVEVPGFLPDTPASRSMLLDYADEIEHFDVHLARIIASLGAAGELDNTLIIVTADNGMPMPRAKANGYDYGIHVPLAIRWGKGAGTAIDESVGFVDLSATVVDAAGLEVPGDFVGDSLVSLLRGEVTALDPERAVFSGRERHSSSRYRNLSYPQRMMRRGEYLIIWNARPELDPAGQARSIEDGNLSEPHSAYYDIDDSMIKRELITRRDDAYIGPFFHLAVDKRPEWQLYHIASDPECLTDLSGDSAYAGLFEEYQQQLTETLTATGDPRALGNGKVWEDYPRMRGPMRYFPQPEAGN